MIFIDRDRTDESGRPIRPDDDWFERAARHRGTAELTAAAGSRPTLSATLYKEPTVRAALSELFHGKCAYCETRIDTRFDWDVEHYRPKGRVAGRADHPGYYWLAVEWSNLYPACTDCNQLRVDRGTYDDPGDGPAAGKLDKFPLWDEAARAMDHTQDLGRETPMLLDPCEDNPEVYFAYDVTGGILPREGAAIEAYAAESIEILHLNTKRLKDARRRRVLYVRSLLERARTLEREGEEVAAEVVRSIAEELRSDSEEYAGAIRHVLADPAAFGIA